MTDTNEIAACTLLADGYQVTIKPLAVMPRDKARAKIMLGFSLVPSSRVFGDMQHEVVFGIELEVLERLITYFKDHIQALKRNNRHESRPYVDGYGDHFQFHAFSGFIDEEENYGYFRLTFMYNIGCSGGDDSRWIGFESYIEIKNVEHFIATLREALEAIQTNS